MISPAFETFFPAHECESSDRVTLELYAPENGRAHGKLLGSLVICAERKEAVISAFDAARVTTWVDQRPRNKPCGDAFLFEREDLPTVRDALEGVTVSGDDEADAGTVERLHTCERPRAVRFELADDTAAVGNVTACQVHAQEAETTAKAARLDVRAVSAMDSDSCGTLRVLRDADADGITAAFRADPFACSEWPCFLAQGHAGPHEPDADDVKPCPVTNCALLAGHTGPCMSLDAEEFTT